MLENVIVQYVLKTLQRDKELLEKLGTDSFRIIGLENEFRMTFDGFKFVGYIDRMDSFLPGEVRIVDYKTGKVENNDVNITEALFGEDNRKRPKIAFQLFLYDYLAAGSPAAKDKVLVNSIYQPAKLFTEEVRSIPMSPVFNQEVEERLHGLLVEIKDPSIPWKRTDDKDTCSWCDFKMICGRQ